jgi:cellulose synthase/poly-beta-1,6-N-acetylglucosamine synthase-like glycosyltransferase/exo-beta-1,3-glucanase (GH17 family)
MRSVPAAVALVVCVAHAPLWTLTQQKITAPDVHGPLASVSYSPFQRHPEAGYKPTVGQIRGDLKRIAPYARAIRTYSSTGGVELVPRIAADYGLRVSVGAWLGDNKQLNQSELRCAIDLVRKNHNASAIVVGNETIYRGQTALFDDEDPDQNLCPDAKLMPLFGDKELSAEEVQQIKAAHELKSDNGANDGARVSPEDKVKEDINVAHLIKVLQRVKRETDGRVPVTTGEIWSVWKDHPELVSAVDFIAVHILPYWEGCSASDAVNDTLHKYNQLRERYPGKRIVIAEFGWPSGGYNYKSAEPGRMEQAEILRDFVARAETYGIDYNIIEAYDQPWKTFEGSVGAYWGLFDASREPQFPWTGPIINPEHQTVATVAIVVSLLLSIPVILMARATFGQVLLLSVSANVVGAWAATVFAYWDGHYFVPGSAFALGLGLLLLVPLVAIALSRMQEIGAVLFAGSPQRLVASAKQAPAGFAPKVSIHIPAHNEPPEMLKATLDSVAGLDYPNFECIVVINNTPDPALWRPVEDYCRQLGSRFKFINVENLVGYKAGALRLALARTAQDAEIVGVLDADYVVHPDWLKDLIPAFADPQVGLIQAPQDHRDGGRSPLHRAMNGEYAGFFDIGMVQRNEANAIIVHGTMCLIRREALELAGGWSSDTICEDTDLGLTILERGWIAHYTNRRYGHGLLPDSFDAYKKQRHRWAYGGFQIVRKHWRRFLPGMTRLSTNQKREFAMGWINWLGAESIGVAVAILNLIWVPIVAFVGIAVPDKVLTVPIIAAFVVSVAHFAVLYRRRVAIPAGQTAGAMIAAMSMQWTVARAVGFGLIRDHLPFVRTAKGGGNKRKLTFPAFHESILGVALVVGAIVVLWTNYQQVREINLFGYVLLVQSLPFLSAALLALFEDTPANDFAFWQNLEARFRELVLRRPTVANTIAKANAIAGTIAQANVTTPVADKSMGPAQ